MVFLQVGLIVEGLGLGGFSSTIFHRCYCPFLLPLFCFYYRHLAFLCFANHLGLDIDVFVFIDEMLMTGRVGQKTSRVRGRVKLDQGWFKLELGLVR